MNNWDLMNCVGMGKPILGSRKARVFTAPSLTHSRQEAKNSDF